MRDLIKLLYDVAALTSGFACALAVSLLRFFKNCFFTAKTAPLGVLSMRMRDCVHCSALAQPSVNAGFGLHAQWRQNPDCAGGCNMFTRIARFLHMTSYRLLLINRQDYWSECFFSFGVMHCASSI